MAECDDSRPPDGNVTGSVTLLIGRLRANDGRAARELWSRFFPRMRGLARNTLARAPTRVADADDAAQSAFVSFWQQVELGRMTDELDRHSLWQLLATITVRKALKQVERERTQKRGGGLVRVETDCTDSAGSGSFRLDEALGEMPTQEFDLLCEELLLQLNDELRQIAVLRLMGYTNAEVAKLLNCTERRIQRKLQLIRLKWEHAVEP